MVSIVLVRSARHHCIIKSNRRGSSTLQEYLERSECSEALELQGIQQLKYVGIQPRIAPYEGVGFKDWKLNRSLNSVREGSTIWAREETMVCCLERAVSYAKGR